jgi:hypothetical protein
MNVIISVVRKGGKKRKQVPRVWTVGEKPKKEEAKREEGQGTRQKEETGIIDSKGKILDAFKRGDTSTRRWRCKFFFLKKRRRLDLCVCLLCVGA